MANMRFIATTKEKLDSIEKVDGQVIFVRDEQVIYLDSENKRDAFKNILIIDTEANRAETTGIEGSFYYVEDSKLLYRYKDSQWNCLNSSEIIFSDRQSFPELGDASKIYIADNIIYKWDTNEADYIKIGCGDAMKELHWGSIK